MAFPPVPVKEGSLWVLQAFHVLKKTANAVLTALAKSPFLKIKANSFDSILEDPVLDPGVVSCSSLDVIHYWDPGNADCSNNGQAVADKGLLTVIFADTEAGLQVNRLCIKLLNTTPVMKQYGFQQLPVGQLA